MSKVTPQQILDLLAARPDITIEQAEKLLQPCLTARPSWSMWAFIRRLFGLCPHSWSKWEYHSYGMQHRHCVLCGKGVRRYT